MCTRVGERRLLIMVPNSANSPVLDGSGVAGSTGALVGIDGFIGAMVGVAGSTGAAVGVGGSTGAVVGEEAAPGKTVNAVESDRRSQQVKYIAGEGKVSSLGLVIQGLKVK